MAKFRKKPVVIEAVQLTWKNWSEICDFMGDIIGPNNPGMHGEASDPCGEASPYINIIIPTLEGNLTARHGDWIIKGVKGEFYACRSDIFELTYEKVS